MVVEECRTGGNPDLLQKTLEAVVEKQLYVLENQSDLHSNF